MTEKEAQQRAIRRHALWLFGAALAIFTTYVVYVYMFTLNN